MKRFVLLQGDGMPDLPIDEKGGKTVLELAKTINLDFLASRGNLARSIPFLKGSSLKATSGT